MRFWCFLVHSIHSGTFFFQLNKLQEGNRTCLISFDMFEVFDIEACACTQRVVRPETSINQSLKIEKAPRLVPSMEGEGII